MTDTKQKSVEVEQLKQQEDIKRAFKTSTPAKKSKAPVVEARHKIFIGSYVLMLLALGGVYYLLRLRFFGFAARYVPLIQRLTLGAMAIVLVLAWTTTLHNTTWGASPGLSRGWCWPSS
jgi:hypothetical protein